MNNVNDELVHIGTQSAALIRRVLSDSITQRIKVDGERRHFVSLKPTCVAGVWQMDEWLWVLTPSECEIADVFTWPRSEDTWRSRREAMRVAGETLDLWTE